MTFPARPRTMRPMRTLALALSSAVAACSASSNAPPVAGDAGGGCNFTGGEVRYDGGCVTATDSSCGPTGMRCTGGTHCAVGGDGVTIRFVCITD